MDGRQTMANWLSMDEACRLLGVKPQMLGEVAPKVAPAIGPSTLVLDRKSVV